MGAWYPDVLCASNPCPMPPLEYACCFTDYTCQVLTEADCLSAGGMVYMNYTTCEPNPCLEVPVQEACTHGFWKNNPDEWAPTGYAPTDLVSSVFVVPSELAGDTLMQALDYRGGSKFVDAARILLRTAVGALLNAAHPEVNFPLTEAEIIAGVNAALATGDRRMVLGYVDTLVFPELMCPLE